MDRVLFGYAAFVMVVRYAVFVLAIAAAVAALADWLVRTRRLNPFGVVARVCRRVIDPLMAPIERRVVRAGGLPSNAPWWMLAAVVIGGLLLVYLLNFLGGLLRELLWGFSSPGRLGVLLLGWVFDLLRIAIIARVVASWIRISPYSRWVRWSWVLTEWMLAPLRRVVPTIGSVDITPLIAWFGLALIQGALGIP